MEQSDLKTFTSAQGTMCYEVTGKEGAPAVILMHGWGCTHSTVRSIASALMHTHRIYNVDFPGFGDSPEPIDVWGVESYSSLIEEFIDTLKIPYPTLIGHSFGGRVAIVTAARRGTQIPKMVLVDSAGVKPKRSPNYYLKVYSYKLTRRIARLVYGQQRAAEMAAKAMKRRASADYLSASPQMRRILSRVVNEDLRHLMPHIKASTLLIWGADDTATPLRDARIMEKLIPDAGLVVFDGCGHYSFLDAPRQFAAVIKSFLG